MYESAGSSSHKSSLVGIPAGIPISGLGLLAPVPSRRVSFPCGRWHHFTCCDLASYCSVLWSRKAYNLGTACSSVLAAAGAAETEPKPVWFTPLTAKTLIYKRMPPKRKVYTPRETSTRKKAALRTATGMCGLFTGMESMVAGCLGVQLIAVTCCFAGAEAIVPRMTRLRVRLRLFDDNARNTAEAASGPGLRDVTQSEPAQPAGEDAAANPPRATRTRRGRKKKEGRGRKEMKV